MINERTIKVTDIEFETAPQDVPAVVQETVEVYTPETFAIQWSDDPLDQLDIPLDFPYSRQEWDEIFARLINFLPHSDRRVRDCAVDRLIRALDMEASQVSNLEEYQPKADRLTDVLDAIATHTPTQPDLFQNFCCKFKFNAKKTANPNNAVVRQWLAQLAAESVGDASPTEKRPAPTLDEITAAQIYFGAHSSTWQESGSTLLSFLDHSDLTIRACAAYQIARFYSKDYFEKKRLRGWKRNESLDQQGQQSACGIPPLVEMLELIRVKELQRPGVAGAFWDEVPKQEFDAREWLLDILERLPNPEPYIAYFPCNLAFNALEGFTTTTM
jgi:hypothetical protein